MKVLITSSTSIFGEIMAECILCGQQATIEGLDPLDQRIRYSCQNCRTFIVSSKFNISFYRKEEKGYLLSGYIREMNENGRHDTYITTENYKELLNSPLIPRTIGEKAEKLLSHFYHTLPSFGQLQEFHTQTDCSICYAKSPDEAASLFDLLAELRYIKEVSMGGVFVLTIDGIEKAEQLEKKSSVSTICFVAMWFKGEMDSVYENAIKPAIEAEECGNYKAFRVDNKQHNNDITDEIIAGIRKCRFMVADMTGYRGGVYFEAGFAKGLGKPVIFTCKKDWFEGNDGKDGKPVKEKVHFDINHQNIIVWETEEELRKRIIDRIRATIYKV